MARVICTLPNASTEIDGVTFAADRGQMISEDLDQAVADRFATIPGFQIVAPPAKPIPTPKADTPQQATTSTEALAGEAELTPAEKRKRTLAAKVATAKPPVADREADKPADGDGAGDAAVQA